MSGKRNRKLIRKYGGEVMPFRDLPIPAQLSIAYYMAVDGEAWDLPPKTDRWNLSKLQRDFKSLLPDLRKRYGDVPIGYVMLPMKELTKAIVEDPEVRALRSFASYEEFDEYVHSQPWFTDTVHPTRNRWPVILSSFDEETFQDGWHRFHAYYHQGAKEIPAVYYP